MSNEWIYFKIKTWHFIVIFLALVLLTNIIGVIGIGKYTETDDEGILTDLNGKSISESIGSGTNFVLFYAEDSDACSMMAQNLSRIAKEDDRDDVNFMKLDIEKHPGMYGKHEISGVPSVVIFKDGVETSRIVGVVPVSNLKVIYKRVTK